MKQVAEDKRLTLTPTAQGGALQRTTQGDLVDPQAAYAEMTRRGGDPPPVIVIEVDGGTLPATPEPQGETPTMSVGEYMALDALASAFGCPELSPRPRTWTRQEPPRLGYYGGITPPPPPRPPSTDRFGRPWQDAYTPRRTKRRPRWLVLLILLALTTLAAAIPMIVALGR